MATEKETVKLDVGAGRPKGYGWSLKMSGEQTGKDYNIWERTVKKIKMSCGGMPTKKYVNPVTIVDNRKKK